MTDKRLRTFCAVADRLSFSKAAELLGVSQSAVTQSVASLEKEIGAALFLRVSNNVMLTDKGAELLETARKILALYRSIDDLKDWEVTP